MNLPEEIKRLNAEAEALEKKFQQFRDTAKALRSSAARLQKLLDKATEELKAKPQ